MIYVTIYTLVFIFRVIMQLYFILCLFIKSISDYNQIPKMDVNSGWISKTPLEEKNHSFSPSTSTLTVFKYFIQSNLVYIHLH